MENNNSVTLVNKETGELAPFSAAGLQMFSSLNKELDEHKPLILKAMGSSDYTAEDILKQPFLTRDILVHMVEITDDAGETKEALRTVLISPDGKTCSFVSEGVLRSIRNVIAVYGQPTWETPLNLQLREAKTRKKFTVYNLEVVI